MSRTVQHDPYFSEQADDSRYVTALARGLMLLSCFDRHTPSLTHQQLCEKTGLPKATVSRLIFTLLATGYLSQADKNSYQVGIQALKLGHVASRLYDISNLTADSLQAFAIAHQVSVNIATYDNGVMRYVACYRSPARVSVNLQVGSEVPMASTAIGRAFFATSDADSQTQMLAMLAQHLSPMAYKGVSEQLNQAKLLYQTQQYALSDGEFLPEILAVAVGMPQSSQPPHALQSAQSFQPSNARPHYAINVSVPRVSPHPNTALSASDSQVNWLITQVLPALRQLAQEISQRIAMI
ncbi:MULTISPECIES: IclR family transcriptional regulator [unclassified Moraxella]|uniref:IclR family transcriptional regulator n=1 Tax=unclassified Moraxella TaxID=2685852 RepID=UPI003AF9F9DF